LGWGARGIALGTAVAEWTTLGVALLLAYRVLRPRHVDREHFWPSRRITSRAGLAKMLTSNADIMIRTLSLLMGFAWFTNQSARFGDTTLAANHILLQFLSFSAFFLDGYAFVAESLVGAALGAREREQFHRAVRRSTELSALTASLLGAGIFLLGSSFVNALTEFVDVREAAHRAVPWAALYVTLGFAAFQLDGVFIGATRTREMRNAAIAALAIFLGTSWPLTYWLGNQGLWLSFTVYVVARAVTLAAYYPRLLRAIAVST
jgi:multidrug resistance protein, MATE family